MSQDRLKSMNYSELLGEQRRVGGCLAGLRSKWMELKVRGEKLGDLEKRIEKLHCEYQALQFEIFERELVEVM